MLDGQGGQVGVRHIIVEGQGGSHILMPSAGHHDVKHFEMWAGWRRPQPFEVCELAKRRCPGGWPIHNQGSLPRTSQTSRIGCLRQPPVANVSKEMP
jgi:hypothetical protein